MLATSPWFSQVYAVTIQSPHIFLTAVPPGLVSVSLGSLSQEVITPNTSANANNEMYFFMILILIQGFTSIMSF